MNFQFALPATSFWMKAVNGLNVIAEYDSYSVNCGIGYNFWKDYISGVVELTQCKYPSADGIQDTSEIRDDVWQETTVSVTTSRR